MNTQPAHHQDCPDFLRRTMAQLMEVDVTTTRPSETSHPPKSYICPHGQQFWVVPTPAQVLRWRRDGVA